MSCNKASCNKLHLSQFYARWLLGVTRWTNVNMTHSVYDIYSPFEVPLPPLKCHVWVCVLFMYVMPTYNCGRKDVRYLQAMMNRLRKHFSRFHMSRCQLRTHSNIPYLWRICANYIFQHLFNKCLWLRPALRLLFHFVWLHSICNLFAFPAERNK